MNDSKKLIAHGFVFKFIYERIQVAEVIIELAMALVLSANHNSIYKSPPREIRVFH